MGIVRGLRLRRLLLLLFCVEGDIFIVERVVDCVVEADAGGVKFLVEGLKSFLVRSFRFAALETLEVFGC